LEKSTGTQLILSELTEQCRRVAALGFMACTGGNISARMPGDELIIAISRSGIDKARIGNDDYILVSADGKPVPPDARKPSDETLLHLAIYREAKCQSVCHGHPPYAVAMSMDAAKGIEFQGIEMQKAFAGTKTHERRQVLAVVENDQDMNTLAQRVSPHCKGEIPAVLVRGHGVYAWGSSVSEAARHLETVEWLCRVEYIRRSVAH
jgi:methylthioribulose-1-phosphate dehydratase